MPDNSENKFSFTKTKIRALKPEKKRKTYRHEDLKGFILEVSPSGTKTFRVYKRVKGQSSPVKITLGTFPDLTVDKAKERALEVLAMIAQGINPNDQRAIEAISNTTLMEAYLSYKKSKDLEDVTIRGYDQCINTYIPDWHDKLISQISEEDIKTQHILVSERSEAQADYCMRVLRAVYNYAMHEFKASDGSYLIKENPVDILKHQRRWNNVPRKQSRLTKSEILKLYKTLSKLRADNTTDEFMLAVCDFVEFGLFTGLRKNNLLELEWSRVNLEDNFFYISKTKNGDPLELPISDHLMVILQRRRKVTDNNYVFQADNEHGYVREPRKCIDKICELAGLDFNMHDLRRTFTSIAELQKVGPYALKRLLNHRTARNDVTGGYTVFTAEELRVPSEEVQNAILLSMGLPLYGQSIDVRLQNLVSTLSKTEKKKALDILVDEFCKE
ncbi:tyrosine-type recombinase/integrase [Aliiglaciecola sp. SL4]|uniref:tyrosine-type recombinase/integrase n=1 Tax=Aliiglaciecola sp. SL4 TaxID=3239806 RepID=UPI00355C6DA0